jgi:hypothetical protein
MMDAASPIKNPRATPRENSLSLCLNCGACYTLHANRWRPTTLAERQAMPPEMKRKILHMQIVRPLIVTTDLTKRDSRA